MRNGGRVAGIPRLWVRHVLSGTRIQVQLKTMLSVSMESPVDIVRLQMRDTTY